MKLGGKRGSQSHAGVDGRTLQNGELIEYLRGARVEQDSRLTESRRSTAPVKKKVESNKNARLLKVSMGKTLKSLVDTNKAFSTTTKKHVKRETKRYENNTVNMYGGDCKHYCHTFKQQIDMFHKFSNADKFARQLRKKLATDSTAHYRVADVLKKHAFHNINLLNDLKNI